MPWALMHRTPLLRSPYLISQPRSASGPYLVSRISRSAPRASYVSSGASELATRTTCMSYITVWCSVHHPWWLVHQYLRADWWLVDRGCAVDRAGRQGPWWLVCMEPVARTPGAGCWQFGKIWAARSCFRGTRALRDSWSSYFVPRGGVPQTAARHTCAASQLPAPRSLTRIAAW